MTETERNLDLLLGDALAENERLKRAASDLLQSIEYMLNHGEWYSAQTRADAMRAVLRGGKHDAS